MKLLCLPTAVFVRFDMFGLLYFFLNFYYSIMGSAPTDDGSGGSRPKTTMTIVAHYDDKTICFLFFTLGCVISFKNRQGGLLIIGSQVVVIG